MSQTNAIPVAALHEYASELRVTRKGRLNTWGVGIRSWIIIQIFIGCCRTSNLLCGPWIGLRHACLETNSCLHQMIWKASRSLLRAINHCQSAMSNEILCHARWLIDDTPEGTWVESRSYLSSFITFLIIFIQKFEAILKKRHDGLFFRL
jgi:hypothetical protein